VSQEDDISRVFAKIKSSKFGFCQVEAPDGMRGLITLRDLLSLYDRGIMETDLSAGDVASRIFQMREDSLLRDALHEMLRRRMRRVFVSGTRTLVSDRRIMSHIFNSTSLEALKRAPYNMLDVTLREVGPVEPTEIDGGASVQKAAHAIRGETEECVLCPAGVVTPWDLIMKPWTMGRLRIRD
jgi:CBS domain-containing protein